MNVTTLVRPCLNWLAAAFAVGALLVAALGLLVQSDAFRARLIRLVELRTGRPIRVGGALRLAVFSLHPTVHAEQVEIGNPSWVLPGRMADIGTLDMAFDWPGVRHPAGISRLEAGSVALHLFRDADGRANWQWRQPGSDGYTPLPIIRSLALSDVEVHLDDQRRHLRFDGRASLREVTAPDARKSLQLEGTGILNERPASLTIAADSLAGAAHDRPYRFRFDERSSGSRLTGFGTLPRPFDFRDIDASFDASGQDLKDLYFLTGVSLTNTGPYTLTGRFALRNLRTTIRDLKVVSGSSDVAGDVTIDSTSGRPALVAVLTSKRLRLGDLGLRAAGREPAADESRRLLLSTAAVNPAALRRMDSTVQFLAERLDVGRVPLHAMAATISVERGILNVARGTAQMLGGQVVGRLRLDANQDPATARLELRFDDLHLERLAQDAGNSPIEGPLSVRAVLTGTGNSLHQAAAGADGTVTADLRGGSIRSTLAELSGLDLRGLGLLLSRSGERANIRCGVAAFTATRGTFVAERLILDTDAALITGTGSIRLDTEALDLRVRGTPRHLRLLRLESTLAVHGTLLHPSISIAPGHAGLRLVDPGLPADPGCAAASGAVPTTPPRVGD